MEKTWEVTRDRGEDRRSLKMEETREVMGMEERMGDD